MISPFWNPDFSHVPPAIGVVGKDRLGNLHFYSSRNGGWYTHSDLVGWMTREDYYFMVTQERLDAMEKTMNRILVLVGRLKKVKKPTVKKPKKPKVHDAAILTLLREGRPRPDIVKILGVSAYRVRRLAMALAGG